MPFANNPIFAWERNTYRAQLREDLIYEDTEAFRLYVVPNRFYTDFASIPRFLWVLASPYDPQHRLAATLHDYLYLLRGGDPYHLGRSGCDLVFLQAMLSEGQAKWRANAMYRAVRTFGGVYSKLGGKGWLK
jgi:hypothetical protein